jgi:hypothetical protein
MEQTFSLVLNGLGWPKSSVYTFTHVGLKYEAEQIAATQKDGSYYHYHEQAYHKVDWQFD